MCPLRIGLIEKDLVFGGIKPDDTGSGTTGTAAAATSAVAPARASLRVSLQFKLGKASSH